MRVLSIKLNVIQKYHIFDGKKILPLQEKLINIGIQSQNAVLDNLWDNDCRREIIMIYKIVIVGQKLF